MWPPQLKHSIIEEMKNKKEPEEIPGPSDSLRRRLSNTKESEKIPEPPVNSRQTLTLKK